MVLTKQILQSPWKQEIASEIALCPPLPPLLMRMVRSAAFAFISTLCITEHIELK